MKGSGDGCVHMFFCLYVGWGSFTGVILFDAVIMCTAGGWGGWVGIV